jgi:hypothetical protein
MGGYESYGRLEKEETAILVTTRESHGVNSNIDAVSMCPSEFTKEFTLQLATTLHDPITAIYNRVGPDFDSYRHRLRLNRTRLFLAELLFRVYSNYFTLRGYCISHTNSALPNPQKGLKLQFPPKVE